MSTLGHIITAPGAANTTPKGAKRRAKRRPGGHILYSAKHPKLLAAYLWASSWKTKPTETVINEIGKSERMDRFRPPANIIENASASTKAEMSRSLISPIQTHRYNVEAKGD